MLAKHVLDAIAAIRIELQSREFKRENIDDSIATIGKNVADFESAEVQTAYTSFLQAAYGNDVSAVQAALTQLERVLQPFTNPSGAVGGAGGPLLPPLSPFFSATAPPVPPPYDSAKSALLRACKAYVATADLADQKFFGFGKLLHDSIYKQAAKDLVVQLTAAALDPTTLDGSLLQLHLEKAKPSDARFAIKAAAEQFQKARDEAFFSHLRQ